MNLKTKSFLILLLALFLPSCTFLEMIPPKSSIIGSWQHQDPSVGALILTFNEDLTFEVDGNADGKKDIWGKYSIKGNRIKFLDDKPREITLCYEAGFHDYFITKDGLTFNLVADQCKPRKMVLSYLFKKLTP